MLKDKEHDRTVCFWICVLLFVLVALATLIQGVSMSVQKWYPNDKMARYKEDGFTLVHGTVQEVKVEHMQWCPDGAWIDSGCGVQLRHLWGVTVLCLLDDYSVCDVHPNRNIWSQEILDDLLHEFYTNATMDLWQKGTACMLERQMDYAYTEFRGESVLEITLILSFVLAACTMICIATCIALCSINWQVQVDSVDVDDIGLIPLPANISDDDKKEQLLDDTV